MFSGTSYSRNPASILEERKLLEQLVSFGVGYPHGNRLGFSEAAIWNTPTLYEQLARLLRPYKDLDATNVIQEAQNHVRHGDDGYYLLDLHKGQILAGGQYPIEDIMIDFTFWNTDERVLLRRRKDACLHDTRFLVVPDAVYFLGMNRTCVPLQEFHVLLFIHLDDDSKTGFVMDYDVSQGNRPLVIFPCEENSGIIQEQLNHDDHCWTEEFGYLYQKHRKCRF